MAALTVAQDQRRNDLDPVDDTTQVHPQSAVPGFEVRILRIAAAADAGVVAQNMDLAERTEGRLGGAAQLLAIAHIRVHDMHVAAPAEGLLHLLEIVPVEVHDHDLHPEAQEVLRHCLTDAARAAGHECNSAGEYLHLGSEVGM